MAIYSLDIRPISRSQNRSIVAAAAYRTATRIEDKRSSQVFDYRRKVGVAKTVILARTPLGSLANPRPDFASELWNTAEASENRSNSVLGRELVVALPNEFTPEQCERVSRRLGEYLVETLHVAAMMCIHDPDRDTNDRNKHLHCLISSRRVAWNFETRTFAFGEKTRELDDRARGSVVITQIRKKWEELANEELKSSGVTIDCRSLEDRGISRPARVHLGPKASAMERKGKRTRSGDHNRAVDELEAAEIDLARIVAEEAAKVSTPPATLTLSPLSKPEISAPAVVPAPVRAVAPPPPSTSSSSSIAQPPATPSMRQPAPVLEPRRSSPTPPAMVSSPIVAPQPPSRPAPTRPTPAPAQAAPTPAQSPTRQSPIVVKPAPTRPAPTLTPPPPLKEPAPAPDTRWRPDRIPGDMGELVRFLLWLKLTARAYREHRRSETLAKLVAGDKLAGRVVRRLGQELHKALLNWLNSDKNQGLVAEIGRSLKAPDLAAIEKILGPEGKEPPGTGGRGGRG
jgi:hypothetical protein